jgi:hypothetical protein
VTLDTAGLVSLPGVCEVDLVRGAGTSSDRGRLLVEVPHGAISTAEFDAVRERLASNLPDRLERFFFVNTDVGAPEVAREVARQAAAAGSDVVILRGLVPRTFVDFNRVLDPDESGMTPGIPPYVDAPADREWLAGLHREYQDVAALAHERVVGRGGLALLLHTYAPRSVGIEQVDERIVDNLEAAYLPGVYETWDLRPEVDLICETADGRLLASEELLSDVEQRYAAIGITATRNGTYHLHPATMGHRWAVAHPARTLSVEIRRDLLAAPFRPFEEMHIDPASVNRLATPLGSGLQSAVFTET